MFITRPSARRCAPARSFSLALLLSAAGLPCAAQPVPTFTDIGTVPGSALNWLNGVSADGNVAVGNIQMFNGEQHVARWSRQTGLQDLGGPTGNGFAFATSGDGSVIVGTYQLAGGRAFRLASAAWSEIPLPPGGSAAAARGVSHDGAVVVGNFALNGLSRAFRWTSGTGFVALPIQAGSVEAYRPVIVSGNGEFIFGAGNPNTSGINWTAFRYANGQYLPLPPLAGYTDSFAEGVNHAGDVAVGNSYNWTNGMRAPVRWRIAPGGGATPEPLGMLPGVQHPFAFDVSDDGEVVVGMGEYSDHRKATIWTSSGPRDLNALLASMGVTVAPLWLSSATGISGDGSVIVGHSDWAPTTGVTRHGWVIDFRRDTDGDGLLDHWEINGIPYINDLGQAKRLHLPGADPAHKDLYLEIDSMAGMSIQQAAVDLVVQAFADAPLTNPDGTTGVRLHVLMDETDLEHRPLWVTIAPDTCWPADYSTYYDEHFGTDAERATNGGPGESLRSAKAKAYRYCLVADRAGPKDWLGCGETPGDKFVVFAGALPEVIDQAATFMHELGHNLGLEHGGDQKLQGKPNYPSIMNYTLTHRSDWNESFWRLDFSREGPSTLGNLDELSLDETRGIGTAAGSYTDFLMPFGVSDANGRTLTFVPLDGTPIDFGSPSGNGIPDGNFTTDVIQDLNYLPIPSGVNLPTDPSPGDTLTAHNDWANIVLAPPRASGPGAPLPAFPEGELTLEGKNWIAANFPIPGGSAPCYANCDGSIGTPLLTANDFQCFLNQFAANATYANCDGSTGTPLHTANDFQCFLNKFAAGCT